MALNDPGATWRFFLCDRSGHRLANITKIARGKTVEIRRNKPCAFKATLPAGAWQCKAIHTDGYPFLMKQMRTVKGYRLESVDDVNTYVLRFAGIVWQVQDDGDENGVAQSQITAYSPFILLPKLPISAAGTSTHLVFDGIDAGEILAAVITDAQQYFGGYYGA